MYRLFIHQEKGDGMTMPSKCVTCWFAQPVNGSPQCNVPSEKRHLCKLDADYRPSSEMSVLGLNRADVMRMRGITKLRK